MAHKNCLFVLFVNLGCRTLRAKASSTLRATLTSLHAQPPAIQPPATPSPCKKPSCPIRNSGRLLLRGGPGSSGSGGLGDLGVEELLGAGPDRVARVAEVQQVRNQVCERTRNTRQFRTQRERESWRLAGERRAQGRRRRHSRRRCGERQDTARDERMEVFAHRWRNRWRTRAAPARAGGRWRSRPAGARRPAERPTDNTARTQSNALKPASRQARARKPGERQCDRQDAANERVSNRKVQTSGWRMRMTGLVSVVPSL